LSKTISSSPGMKNQRSSLSRNGNKSLKKLRLRKRNLINGKKKRRKMHSKGIKRNRSAQIISRS
jgi:hypothetical protein